QDWAKSRVSSLRVIRRARFEVLPEARVRFEISSVTAAGLEHRAGSWKLSAIKMVMFKAVEGIEPFPRRTGLLVDVSESTDDPLSENSETTRLDVVCGLARGKRLRTPFSLCWSWRIPLRRRQQRQQAQRLVPQAV